MIKCLFVDIKSICSEISHTEFDEAQIDRLADLILATDGLIRPLILQQTGTDKYTVIEGNLEYHAAVRAKAKNLRAAEMVNAFIIPEKIRSVAIAQLALLSQTQIVVAPISTPIDPSVDRLSPAILAAIAEGLQPLQQQLDTVSTRIDRHQEILASLSPQPAPAIAKIERLIPAPAATSVPIERQDPPAPPLENAEIAPPSTPKTKRKSASTDRSAPAASPTVSKPAKQPAKKAPAAKTTVPAATTAKNRLMSPGLAASDPAKLAATLHLINTLDLQALTLKMLKTIGVKGIEAITTDIIASRDTQPTRKFESWETLISLKIPKLTSAMALKIVDKLR